MINKIIQDYNLNDFDKLVNFIKNNELDLSMENIFKICEISNNNRYLHSAYFTDLNIVKSLVDELPSLENKKEIVILEPAVGVGNFIPSIISKYKSKEKVTLILNDIDSNLNKLLKIILSKIDIPKNFIIKITNYDYLEQQIQNIDLIIGNPPYKNNDNPTYKKTRINTKSNDLFNYFIEKSLQECEYFAYIVPKLMIEGNKYKITRNLLQDYIVNIIDYGEKGFKGVRIETIAIIVNTKTQQDNIKITSYSKSESKIHNKSYVFDDFFPSWLLYRNKLFDDVSKKLDFDIFTAYRDRQITNKDLTDEKSNNIRVLRSRNITSNNIKNIDNYDKYITHECLNNKSVKKFLNDHNAILMPNMTYYPRACFMPKNSIVNGSVAILKTNIPINKKTLEYYSSKEFTEFYKIARNYSTRTLNIDNSSVFYFGKLKDKYNDIN